MRVPQINLGTFALCNSKGQKAKCSELSHSYNQTVPTDTVNFTSTAKYLKKYATLPDEIKKVLTPKDAVDMFKDMEMVAQGRVKRMKIGQGNSSKVYENPWLDDYYLLILKDPKEDVQTIYSKLELGDAIWFDEDNNFIQIIKKSA